MGDMRAYHALIRHLCETDPPRLGQLPPDFLRATAGWLLDHDGYLLEQLDKHTGAAGTLDPARLESTMYAALDAGRTDDFRFLSRMRGGSVDPARVGSAYLRLARRGNIAGIEDVVQATGVPARLDEESARRAYEVLVGTGRLAAADYVRQLSGIPIAASARAVDSGYRVLLLAGRYAGITQLWEFSGRRPRPNGDDLDAAFGRAAADCDFTGLAGVADLLGCAGRFDGFAPHLAELVAAGQLRQIPALAQLCRDARPGDLDTALLAKLAGSTDPAAVAFVYAHQDFTAIQKEYAEHAYRVAVVAGDRALLRTVCTVTGQPLLVSDAGRLLGPAVADGDVDWIRFAGEHASPLPQPPADAAQLLLFDLSAQGLPAVADELARLLGTRYDEPAGRWLSHLRDGRFELAAAMLSEVVDRPAFGSLARALMTQTPRAGDGRRTTSAGL